jgi:hypothetical protein
MRDTPPGEEKDPDTKPTAEEKTAQAPAAAAAKNDKIAGANKAAAKPGPPAEKVENVDPIIAREHTTFYAQVFYDKQAGVWREAPMMVQRPDIACHDGEGANSVGSTVCKTVKEAVDVKPWPRKGPAPAHDPQYYSGEYGGNIQATKEGFIIPKKEGPAPATPAETEPAPASPAGAGAAKKEAEKVEKAKEAATSTKDASAPPNKEEAAKFIYIARALPNGDFIYQRPDIACRDGQGANSVGSTVCSVVKEAVDVKPWVRTGPAPDHQPQYYTGNEGDVASNPDGTLTTSGLLPKTQAGTFLTRRRKVDPIAPSHYDPWVYDFSKFHMPS